MNGARSKARRLLADPGVQTVVAEHRERLGRMNTNWSRRPCSHTGAGWPSWTPMRWTMTWCGM